MRYCFISISASEFSVSFSDGSKICNRGGPRSSTVGARIEMSKAPSGMRCGEGMPPSPFGEGSGENFFDFGSQSVDFYCIVGAIFAVQLPVVHSKNTALGL